VSPPPPRGTARHRGDTSKRTLDNRRSERPRTLRGLPRRHSAWPPEWGTLRARARSAPPWPASNTLADMSEPISGTIGNALRVRKEGCGGSAPNTCRIWLYLQRMASSEPLRLSVYKTAVNGTAAGTPLAVVDNCRALLRRCRPGVYLNKHQSQPPGSIADRNRLV
jgi:hypothetical protein